MRHTPCCLLHKSITEEMTSYLSQFLGKNLDLYDAGGGWAFGALFNAELDAIAFA